MISQPKFLYLYGRNKNTVGRVMEILTDCCVIFLNNLTHNLKRIIMKSYGMELILDLRDCDTSLFRRKHLKRYINELCELIDMTQCKLTWWDYFWWPKIFRDPNPKTYGTSVVQFIMTSNITIHSLDKLGTVYLNIFSCKEFDFEKTVRFTQNWFKGEITQSHVMERG